MIKLKFLTALVAGLCLFPVASARAEDPNIAAPTSFVRVLHAVSGGTKVDVYVDGDKKLNDVEFSHVTKYLRVRSGYHTFRIVGNEQPVTLWSGTRNLKSGDFYTIGAYGTQAWKRPFFNNDSVGYPRFGTAGLTIFHLAPGTPPVDVYAYMENGRPMRLFRNLRYGQIRRISVKAVPLTIRLVQRGRVIKTEGDFDARAGRKYAGFLLGQAGKNFQFQLDVSASQ